MPKKKKQRINFSFKCTARGKLSTTPSNQRPTQFVVDGESTEEVKENGKPTVDRRNVKGGVIVPQEIEKSGFLDDIPLGSEVVFKESGTRISGKKFERSFSVEVL